MSKKMKVARFSTTVGENLPSKESNPCKNCINLQKDVKDLKVIVENQNKIIMETLAAHNLLLKQLIHQDQISGDLLKTFPLMSLEEVEKVENEICSENRLTYH
ncbi:uncharacterized protein [Eurosta solidaginis]|uniref:uncharacterized protein n=1 Tax=Eurosta solidaginis TaxID=178769 RepID=UPI0035309C70